MAQYETCKVEFVKKDSRYSSAFMGLLRVFGPLFLMEKDDYFVVWQASRMSEEGPQIIKESDGFWWDEQPTKIGFELKRKYHDGLVSQLGNEGWTVVTTRKDGTSNEYVSLMQREKHTS